MAAVVSPYSILGCIDDKTRKLLLAKEDAVEDYCKYIFALIKGDLEVVKRFRPKTPDGKEIILAGRFGHVHIINYFNHSLWDLACLIYGENIDLFYYHFNIKHPKESTRFSTISPVYYYAAAETGRKEILTFLEDYHSNVNVFEIMDRAVKSGKIEIMDYCAIKFPHDPRRSAYMLERIISNAAEYGHKHIILNKLSRIDRGMSKYDIVIFIERIVENRQINLLFDVINNPKLYLEIDVETNLFDGIPFLNNSEIDNIFYFNSLKDAVIKIAIDCAAVYKRTSLLKQLMNELSQSIELTELLSESSFETICASNDPELLALIMHKQIWRDKFHKHTFQMLADGKTIDDFEYIKLYIENLQFNPTITDIYDKLLANPPTHIWIKKFKATLDHSFIVKYLSVKSVNDLPYNVKIVLSCMKFCLLCHGVKCDCRKFIGHGLTQLIGNDAGSKSIILTILNYATNII